MQPSNEILVHDDGFWIVCRRRMYGPFLYQWSGDLHGIEFLLRGSKFAEVCGPEQFFADLEPFQLPATVCHVATIIVACMAESLRHGQCMDERVHRILALLQQSGLDRFRVREVRTESRP
ncbi:MAG: hypothetical protein KDA96_11955 [Planctomycetaceae bacterium]|nr:hypothetical protein [Planctomycetaceae bacterium]